MLWYFPIDCHHCSSRTCTACFRHSQPDTLFLVQQCICCPSEVLTFAIELQMYHCSSRTCTACFRHSQPDSLFLVQQCICCPSEVLTFAIELQMYHSKSSSHQLLLVLAGSLLLYTAAAFCLQSPLGLGCSPVVYLRAQ